MTSDFLAAMRAALDRITALEPGTAERLAAEDDMAQLMRDAEFKRRYTMVGYVSDIRKRQAGDTGEP